MILSLPTTDQTEILVDHRQDLLVGNLGIEKHRQGDILTHLTDDVAHDRGFA